MVTSDIHRLSNIMKLRVTPINIGFSLENMTWLICICFRMYLPLHETNSITTWKTMVFSNLHVLERRENNKKHIHKYMHVLPTTCFQNL